MGAITVVGSINMDIVAFAKDHPKRGETIFGQTMAMYSGGKGANQAVTVARLGNEVNLIGAVGLDQYGDQLVQSLKEEHINLSHVKKMKETPTGCAIITVDETAENTMTVIKGANDCISSKEIKTAFAELKDSSVLLVQMEIPESAVIEAMIQARERGMYVILDPAPAEGITKKALEFADVIVPNAQETEELTGIRVHDSNTAERAARELHQLGVVNSIVKMGSKGSLLYQNGELTIIPSIPVHAQNTVGAGDSFAGALATAIANGSTLEEAAYFANIVAALKVSKQGSQNAIPTLEEVTHFCEEKKLHTPLTLQSS